MKSELTDRERILLQLIDGLRSTAVLRPQLLSAWHEPRGDGARYVHFVRYRKPVAGDLVFAETGRTGKWKIGWYVAPLPGGAVIRSIGDGQLCDYRNERFVPIGGMSHEDLFEGDQRIFYVKVLQAFHRGDEYMYRFGGLEFRDQDAVIWVREVFGGFGGESVPFNITMRWSRRTSVKAILAAMKAGGYGTRSFHPDAAKPP